MQEPAKNIVYADVGPLSNNRTHPPGSSLDFEDHRVEYAQLNHKAKVSVSTSAAERSCTVNKGTYHTYTIA